MSVCALRGFCGRPAAHTGQHGGWTTGVRGVAESPVEQVGDSEGDHLGRDLSPSQLRLLVEIARHGDVKRAADCIGITHTTAKHYLTGAHTRTGTMTTIETFAALGWLRAPDELGIAHRGAA